MIEYLTVQDIMKILHIASTSAISRLIRRQGIPCMKFGKRLLFNKNKFETWCRTKEKIFEREMIK